ncbi:MAG: peptidase [Acidobacteriaceae bacterium]|nr:peptidase [Acidobacteriaceae bacterium]MBV9297295.1 peptidase [Acidobacteriaceae bacterium]MBV9766059.1 peptidase [Acidobacteriaceae bacterium]
MRQLLRRPPLVVLAALCASAAIAQTITAPKDQFGFKLGDDYQLTNYTQLVEYWKKLATESDRMKLVGIGKTAEGRTQYMAIVTSPENLKELDRYQEISRKLALADGLSDDDAHALAKEGKAVVWIDGGLHASEVECAQALTEMVYQMVSRNDAETMRFLNDVIILFVQANPDGQELVANWYMRRSDPAQRSLSGVPRLWQKYIGHDNNRDFFMCNMPESTNMNRVLYLDWFPQIVYNHHQTGPRGAVIFMPPFRDPFNYHFDPLSMMELDQVGSAMHSRMEAENKPGAGMRSTASYSTWYNGGLRTTTYFHNMIGLLTEIIGSPTPMDIPLVPGMQLARSDLPLPIAPQKWHLRQSIEYSLTANRAVLDFASRYRETLLYNIYAMGRNSIERGSRDSWTITPRRIEALEAAAPASTEKPAENASGIPAKLYDTVLHDPAMRDPRGYIISADQADLPTAIRFLNALLKNGVEVERATANFRVAGKSYPAGSYVVKTAQAFRPHVLDMFEPQDHPNDFRYPGGPPIPPYDATGYTLAFQMGVQFDRILDGFDVPLEHVSGLLDPPPGSVRGSSHPAGYVVSHGVNNSFILMNRLLKENCDVYWLKTSPADLHARDIGTGAIWVPASAAARQIVERGAKELGLTIYAEAHRPAGSVLKLRPTRIALYDQYGGLMPSGWTRWIFEQFEFPFKVVYPHELDAGDLAKNYDVLVLTDGAIRAPAAPGGSAEGFSQRQPKPEEIPAEYRSWLGVITPEKTAPQIRQFVERGGAVIAIGSSTQLATLLGLPVASALTEKTPDGKERPLPPEKYYVPGSLLTVSVDHENPLAYGVPDRVDVFFDNSPVFRLKPDASFKRTFPVAWFANGKPLHSGWAWGQQYLDGGVAIAESSLGSGKIFLMGPEVAFRGQPHATFKFLLNGIFYGSAKEEIRR